jgi:proliferating cell nuclear antigen PCNA
MNCTFNTVKSVYELFKFTSQFQHNAKMNCTEDGISMFAMSACNSVFVDVQLPKEFFVTYSCPQPTTIGLNLNVLHSVLSNCKGADSLRMQSTDDTLLISVEGLEYTIKQVNIEAENMEIPELEENFSVCIEPKTLKLWKKNIMDFTKSTLCIQPTKDEVVLTSRGDEGNVRMTHKQEYLAFNQPDSITLGNVNLVKVFGIGSVSDTLEMGYKNDMPLRMQANLREATLRVFLAPCIDMEED